MEESTMSMPFTTYETSLPASRFRSVNLMERVSSTYQDDQWPPEQSSADRSKPRGDVDPCVCCVRSTLVIAGLVVMMFFLTKIVDKTLDLGLSAGAPSGGKRGGDLPETDCWSLADYLRGQVDANRDPCVDFYEYACGNYQGGYVLSEMGERVRAAVDYLLPTVVVPDQSQTAVQKAVGMFRACLAAPEDNGQVEMRAVRDFMVSLDMDLLAEETSDPNPGRDTVRLSLECGLHAFVQFKVALATSDEEWFAERALLKISAKASYYSALIAHYSGRALSGSTKALVSQLSALEDEVQTFMTKEKGRMDEHWTFISVRNILDPAQEQKEDEFERIIKEYSLGRYNGDDGVYVNSNAHALLKLLGDDRQGRPSFTVSYPGASCASSPASAATARPSS
ncbi:hypothetical protein MTO96_023627 [Rhipicephalus appendiculatus]